MEKEKVYYLIKPKKGFGYLQKGSMRSTDLIGKGIHEELPRNISLKNDSVYRVISSEGEEFWNLLNQEKSLLESMMSSQKQQLRITKNNVDRIVSFLNNAE